MILTNVADMRKITGILLLIAVMSACQQAADYKTVRDEVMTFHDVVMADHGIIVGNQMRIDTLLSDLQGLKMRFPDADTIKEQASMQQIKKELGGLEDSMNNWMHQFEPDVTGKTNEEAIKYFEDEKKKIKAIDSLYKLHIELSNAYLTKFKK